MSTTTTPNEELKRIFTVVDLDKTGMVDAIELQNALCQGGYNISLQTVAMLIRLHANTNNDARIDFNQFCGLHEFMRGCQDAFGTAAGSPTATSINITQCNQALTSLGFNWMDPPAFQAMYQAFNPSKNGLLGLTEFLAVAAFLKTVLGTFKGFDQAGRGSIVLNLNQFLYAASNTR